MKTEAPIAESGSRKRKPRVSGDRRSVGAQDTVRRDPAERILPKSRSYASNTALAAPLSERQQKSSSQKDCSAVGAESGRGPGGE